MNINAKHTRHVPINSKFFHHLGNALFLANKAYLKQTSPVGHVVIQTASYVISKVHSKTEHNARMDTI